MEAKAAKEYETVKLSDLNVFKERCSRQFKKLSITPTMKNICDIFGSRPFDDESTHPLYMSKIRAFVSYLLASGKWDDSLLIFHPHCPKGVIAVSSLSVKKCLYVAMTPKRKTCLDSKNTPIVDAKGVPVVACASFGLWNANENMNHLSTALKNVHENCHGMTTEYVEECAECLSVYTEKKCGGCVHHPLPRYTKRGNVSNCALVKDTILGLKNRNTHVPMGSCHLLPSDVRSIREYCCARNDKFGMEIYTVLLLSIDGFLRKAEFSSLHGDNINVGLCLLTDYFVLDALNISVKGKRCNTKERRSLRDTYACWRKLWIWGDDLCPDLDVKRHLLAFLYSIEWKGGFLFPSFDEMRNPPADHIYRMCMEKDDLVRELRHLFKDVLKRNDKLSSHSGRKTGYLWARIRGASVEQSMLAAHNTLTFKRLKSI